MTETTTPLTFTEVTATYDRLPVTSRPRVEEKAAKIAKKLAKLGAPAPTVTFGPIIPVEESEEFPFPRKWTWLAYETVTVTGHTVALAGWHPVASLDHTITPDEALISLFPGAIESGESCPDHYRFTGPTCDHCGRRIATRKTTVVFHHEDGRYTQVGTNCILEYIGIDPKVILWLRDATDSIVDADDLGGRYAAAVTTVDEFLAIAAELTLLDGFVPTSAVEQSPTKDRTFGYLNAKPSERNKFFADVDPERGSIAAAAIIDWVANTTDTSEFLTSARLAVRANEVTRKIAGLLAALPFVHNKAITEKVEREQAATRPSEFLGNVGDKLTVTGTVTAAFSVETDYGTSRRVTVKTDDGDVVTTFGSGQTLWGIDPGDRVEIKGTIKGHKDSDRYGKQTELTRTKILVLEVAA